MEDDYNEEYLDESELSDENADYDPEILKHLDNLTRITINILNIYKRIIEFEFKKNNSPIYECFKDLLIQSLITLKQEEDEELDYFFDNISNCTYALDYLEDQYDELSDIMDHNTMLCFTRIHDKLEKMEVHSGVDQNDPEIIEEIMATRKYKTLIKYGLSKEDALFIYMDYSYIIDNSISLRYASILEDEIKTHPADKDYIKIRLEESFASSNDLENVLIRYKFNRIPKNLNEELKPPYQLDTKLQKALISLEIDDSLLDIVNKINFAKEKTELESSILLFKTYLLYLEPYEIKKVVGLLEAVLSKKELKEQLTELVYQYKELQQAQNIDQKKHAI